MSENDDKTEINRGLEQLMETTLGELLDEMHRMNAATIQLVIRDKNDQPVGGVILLGGPTVADNQAVIDAVNRATDPDEEDTSS